MLYPFVIPIEVRKSMGFDGLQRNKFLSKCLK